MLMILSAFLINTFQGKTDRITKVYDRCFSRLTPTTNSVLSLSSVVNPYV